MVLSNCQHSVSLCFKGFMVFSLVCVCVFIVYSPCFIVYFLYDFHNNDYYFGMKMFLKPRPHWHYVRRSRRRQFVAASVDEPRPL